MLGHVKHMQEPKLIQLRPFEIQLAEQYVYNEEADFLLIVNNRTEFDEVQAWRKVNYCCKSFFFYYHCPAASVLLCVCVLVCLNVSVDVLYVCVCACVCVFQSHR